MEKIQQIYNRYKNTPSDINEHLETIFSISQECAHITEMGVRGAVSTYAMLLANPKKMISYDISYNNYEVDRVIQLSNEYDINYKFILADVLKTKIEQTDLLFIDTLHTYNQLFTELNLHAQKVSKYIILHDTESFGQKDEEIYEHASDNIKKLQVSKQGLVPAVTDFLSSERGQSWKIFKTYKNNNGLTILSRKNILRDEDNTNKWNDWYKNLPTTPSEFYYGNTITYRKAADFLKSCQVVEDWGVGAGGFLRYRPDAIGIDGSTTSFAQKQNVNLRFYTSVCDGINMRHVLEHNYCWEDILKNAMESARKKLAITVFTPFSNGDTIEIAHNLKHGVDVPDLSLDREKFIEILYSVKTKKVSHERIATATGYNFEEIFLVEKV